MLFVILLLSIYMPFQSLFRGIKMKNSKNTDLILSGNMHKRKKWLTIANIVLSLTLVVSIFATGYYGLVWYYMGDMEHNEITENSSDLGIDEEAADETPDIINIALFGVDSTDTSKVKGRSDATIVLSVDKKKKTVKMISLLRDSYVPIKDHKMNRINSAYAFGGPVLAINTINKNFKLNITDYVTVNFSMLADIIDIMGGVDIEITEKEKNQINKQLDESYFETSYKSGYVEEYGYVHLNGIQAMQYSRIRKIDSDVQRSQRQIKVLNILFEKIKTISITKYPSMLKAVMKHVETSLSYSEIISYAPLVSGLGKLESIHIPDQKLDKNVIGGNYNGSWVWRYDIGAAADRIHTFIYGNDSVDGDTSDTLSK